MIQPYVERTPKTGMVSKLTCWMELKSPATRDVGIRALLWSRSYSVAGVKVTGLPHLPRKTNRFFLVPSYPVWNSSIKILTNDFQ